MGNIRKSSEVDLVSEYIHIDNGGTTFSLVEFEPESEVGPHPTAIVITDGYFGYSESKISLFNITNQTKGPEHLRKLSQFFMLAAVALEEKKKKDSEKY